MLQDSLPLFCGYNEFVSVLAMLSKNSVLFTLKLKFINTLSSKKCIRFKLKKHLYYVTI